MRWHWQSFEQLSVTQLYRLLAAREAVFVVEQACAYLDADGLDPEAMHLWREDEGGALLAYARVLPPGTRYPEVSIGRVLTTERGRGRGLGRALMAEVLRQISEQFGPVAVRISAQAHLQAFYQDFGFTTVSTPYMEDGILHVEMVRRDCP